ncbi:MAG TPA: SRPBCC domain-containing protein, partial [Actinomycetota bacterium]|nr:SRPBCC domain-containing protein [Actinomycetota bacterium]
MSTEHNVVVTRVLDAPVEPVWRAWSESEQMMRWWGPTGFTCPVARMDVREGGTSLVCMRSPDGHDIYNTWTYERVAPMRELEFIHR